MRTRITNGFSICVCWNFGLELLERDDLILVTNDSAFYEKGQKENGLAKELKKEADSVHHELTIVSTLKDLLKDISKDIAIDDCELAEAFFGQEGGEIEKMLSLKGFTLGDRKHLDRTLFATLNPDQLFIMFNMKFECVDVSGADRELGTLFLTGDGTYIVSSRQFQGIRSHRRELKYPLPGGSEDLFKSASGGAIAIVGGPKEVSHIVRRRLDHIW